MKFVLKERSWALYHYNRWESGWEVNATVIVVSKNKKIFAWVWSSGLVNNDVEESKADFPFSSSLFLLQCSPSFYPLGGRSEVLWAHLPKKLHRRKIYSKVTAAVFLWFHHLRSTKHLSFSRVPKPSQTWPNPSIARRNRAICKWWLSGGLRHFSASQDGHGRIYYLAETSGGILKGRL